SRTEGRRTLPGPRAGHNADPATAGREARTPFGPLLTPPEHYHARIPRRAIGWKGAARRTATAPRDTNRSARGHQPRRTPAPPRDKPLPRPANIPSLDEKPREGSAARKTESKDSACARPRPRRE